MLFAAFLHLLVSFLFWTPCPHWMELKTVDVFRLFGLQTVFMILFQSLKSTLKCQNNRKMCTVLHFFLLTLKSNYTSKYF